MSTLDQIFKKYNYFSTFLKFLVDIVIPDRNRARILKPDIQPRLYDYSLSFIFKVFQISLAQQFRDLV